MSIPESEIQTSPAERALVLAIQIFRLVGGVLLVFFLIESCFSLSELRLRNPASELRFATQMTDRIPMALLGLALLLCHPRLLRTRLELIFLRVLAAMPLGLMIGYLALVPFTMFAAANFFRSAIYALEQQTEEQLNRVRAVRDATLQLPPEQQQTMVDRYNRSNPRKQPVDLAGFLKTLKDEVKSSEAQIERERREENAAQLKKLHTIQLVQTLKLFAGGTAFFFLWRLSGWARPAGQQALGKELGVSRHRGRDR